MLVVFIVAISFNLLRDNARRQKAETRALERIPQETPDSPDALAAVEHRDEVQRAMTVLSDEEREAIALRFGGDLTVPEIAKLLKQPLPRVEGRVYRSLRKLRDALG